MDNYLLGIAEKIIDQAAPQDIAHKYYDLKKSILIRQEEVDAKNKRSRHGTKEEIIALK